MSAQERFKVEIGLKFLKGRLTELRSEERRKVKLLISSTSATSQELHNYNYFSPAGVRTCIVSKNELYVHSRPGSGDAQTNVCTSRGGENIHASPSTLCKYVCVVFIFSVNLLFFKCILSEKICARVSQKMWGYIQELSWVARWCHTYGGWVVGCYGWRPTLWLQQHGASISQHWKRSWYIHLYWRYWRGSHRRYNNTMRPVQNEYG